MKKMPFQSSTSSKNVYVMLKCLTVAVALFYIAVDISATTLKNYKLITRQ